MAGLDALKTLHTDLVNTVSGYDEAIADAQHADTKSLFVEARGLHGRAHDEVHAILRAKGETPDESGSFMGTVQNTMISLRAAVTGLSPSSLNPFITGERSLAGAYEKAIAENGADAATADALTRQRGEVLTLIDKMEARKA